jgi:hypothetical protein
MVISTSDGQPISAHSSRKELMASLRSRPDSLTSALMPCLLRLVLPDLKRMVAPPAQAEETASRTSFSMEMAKRALSSGDRIGESLLFAPFSLKGTSILTGCTLLFLGEMR